MIWLIGCKGMLGTEIARQLTENKIEFVGTDIDVDITNPQALADFAKGKEISYIINCSAYTAVDKAESDAEFARKLNEDGPRNISNLANQIQAKMIHISTDYVFDGSGSSPYTEDMPIAPICVYGKTKADGEAAVSLRSKSMCNFGISDSCKAPGLFCFVQRQDSESTGNYASGLKREFEEVY